MRHRTKAILKVLGLGMLAVLIALFVTLAEPACQSWLWAQEPVNAKLTEVESLKLVNTYQSAVLAQVDFQTAQQRMARTREAYTELAEKLKADHKWPAATTFEINGETGAVLVHLPPTDSKGSQPSHEDTKEQH